MWWDFANEDWRAVYHHWARLWRRLDSGSSCLRWHRLCSQLVRRVSVFNMTARHLLVVWQPLCCGAVNHWSLGPSLKTWPLQNIWLQWINVHSNVANGISVSSKCIKLFVMGLYPRPHLKGSQHCQDPHLLLEWELGFWGQKLPYSGEAEGRVLPWHKVCYCYTVVTKISKYIVLVQISLYRNSQRCTRFCVCCDLSVVTVLCFAYDVLDIHVC